MLTSSPEPQITTLSISSEPTKLSSSFYQPGSSGVPSQIMSTTLSPLPTPGTMVNDFMPAAMTDYDFAAVSTGSEQSSPPLFMDWTQMHYSSPQMQMDHLVRHDMMAGVSGPMGIPGISMEGLTGHDMLNMMGDFPHPFHPLPTPRDSISTTISDIELSGKNMSTPSPRQPSTGAESLELSAVVKAQDGWNCFRCIPTIPSSAVPKTAKLHIEKLEQSLKNHEGWSNWSLAWQDGDTSNDHLDVIPLQECSKDKLLAITQSFLHKALKTHRNSSNTALERGSSPAPTSSNFIILPPIGVLTYFLRAYSNTFERFFPMSAQGTLNVNQKLLGIETSDQAASLLTLMMIAAGSLFVPSMDARWLQAGLVEACRISLFDLVETNISMACDPTVLHSALLFTTTAAWSGDKWHMNIAMGQRGMYTSMLRHSGALDHQPGGPPTHSSPENMHSDWLAKETTSR
jgi:hypothetical protein